MGQYLAIGLVTECSTSKKKLQEHNISKEDLVDKMSAKFHFESSIYDFIEINDNYVFKLKPEILEKQLIPFLEKFYPALYPNDSTGYKAALEELKKAEPATWLKIASMKSYEEFQLDGYAESEFLYFDKPFNPYAKIAYSSIMLSIEGTISMEIYGRQFNFFKYCIQETFDKFPIAKAIRVHITG